MAQENDNDEPIAGIPTDVLSENAIILDGLDDAIVGYTDPGILVYSYNKLVDLILAQWTDDMSRKDAYEWIEFNILGLQSTGDGFVMLYGPRC